MHPIVRITLAVTAVFLACLLGLRTTSASAVSLGQLDPSSQTDPSTVSAESDPVGEEDEGAVPAACTQSFCDTVCHNEGYCMGECTGPKLTCHCFLRPPNCP